LKERLFEILKFLAKSSRKSLSIGYLMRKARYKSISDLHRDLKELHKEGLIDYYWSGFPSDRNAHRKLVVLSADVVVVHEEDEKRNSPQNLSKLDRLILEYVPNEKEEECPPKMLNKANLLTARFAQAIQSGNRSTARKLLELMCEVLPKTEWYAGYLHALNGIYLETKESNTFHGTVQTPEKIKNAIKIFDIESTKPLRANYDKGYFYALKVFYRAKLRLLREIKIEEEHEDEVEVGWRFCY